MISSSFIVFAEEAALHVSRGWVSWLIFYWVNPLMARGCKRQLQAGDLFCLPTKLLPSTCSNLLWHIWAEVWLAPCGLQACWDMCVRIASICSWRVGRHRQLLDGPQLVMPCVARRFAFLWKGKLLMPTWVEHSRL